LAANTNIFSKALAMASALFLTVGPLAAQTAYDSLKISLPKHYFQTVIIADFFAKPAKKLPDTIDPVGRHLKNYAFRQMNLSFYTPLLTQNSYGADSTIIRNSHLLLTGNYTVLKPVFRGLPEQHTLTKIGIGLRYIYNTGKKGVWFADVAPFITRDITFESKGYLRLSSTLVYSHNVSDRFNWRLGITKSFYWGNRYYLPFIGIRIGRLDKVNLSIQIPRSITLNIPVSSKCIISAYTCPQGGLYSFSNKDSLYYNKNDKVFHFTQYQVNTGLRVDVRTGWFNFYIATGISTRNNITFYSEAANNRLRAHLPYNKYFFSENSPASLFLNFGLVLKFGKARAFYNNKNMYDVMDLNNTIGDNSGNTQIPLIKKQRKEDQNLRSIQDLVDYNDF